MFLSTESRGITVVKNTTTHRVCVHLGGTGKRFWRIVTWFFFYFQKETFIQSSRTTVSVLTRLRHDVGMSPYWSFLLLLFF